MSKPTPDEVLRAWDKALLDLGISEGAFVTSMANAHLVAEALRDALRQRDSWEIRFHKQVEITFKVEKERDEARRHRDDLATFLRRACRVRSQSAKLNVLALALTYLKGKGLEGLVLREGE